MATVSTDQSLASLISPIGLMVATDPTRRANVMAGTSLRNVHVINGVRQLRSRATPGAQHNEGPTRARKVRPAVQAHSRVLLAGSHQPTCRRARVAQATGIGRALRLKPRRGDRRDFLPSPVTPVRKAPPGGNSRREALFAVPPTRGGGRVASGDEMTKNVDDREKL